MLTSAQSQPFKLVKVIPASQGFLVLWDNSDDGTQSTKMMRVGVDGLLYGISNIDNGLIAAPNVYVLGDPAHVQTIIWNRVNDSCVALRIDSAANPLGSPVPIGKSITQVYTYSQLPGLYLLRMGGDEGGRVIYKDGRVDPRVVPLNSSTSSLYLGADSSLVVLENSNPSLYAGPRTLHFYHSMFDAAPFRTSTVAMLDTLSSSTSSTSQILAVDRTPAGNYDIYFSVVAISAYDPKSPIQDQLGKRQFTIYHLIDSANGNSSAPEQIFDATKTTDLTNRIVFTSASGKMLDGNSNTRLISYSFPTIVYAQTDSQRTRTTTFEFSMDAFGAFKFDRSYGTPFETTSNGLTGYIPSGIPADSSTTITRVANDTVSVVRVTVNGSSVLLGAPSGPWQPSSITMSIPQIYAAREGLLTSWKRSKNADPATGAPAYQAMDLARWEGTEVTPIDRADAPLIAPTAIDSSQSEQITSTAMDSDFQHAVAGGPPTFLLNQERRDSISYMSGLWDYSRENVQRQGVIGIATQTWWQQAVTVTTEGVTPNEQQPWVEGISWDPNSRELTLASGILPGSSRTLRAFDETGELLWSMPAVTDRGTILPLNSSEYLLINDDSALTYRGVEHLSSLGIPFVNGTTTLYRLLGPWFIRITFTDASNQYIVERFDLQAHRLDSTTLNLPANAGTLGFVQNENDSTLILLYAKNGIRMMRLTQHLQLLYQDSLVSVARSGVVQPAGAMRNDTLFAVWSNGSAIYGNWIRLETIHDTATAGVQSPDISAGISTELVRLYPNPARGAVRIDYHSSKENELEVIDPLGRIVRRMMVPASPNGSVNVSTSDIESGIYLVRLGSGGAASTAQLVVTR